MKKLFALLLCCALLVCLLAACGSADPDASAATPSDIETETASVTEIETEAPEEHDHVHINYKGLETANFTLEDVAAAEGREPDFSFDVGESTYYAYNDVTLNDMTFSQVQYSFSDTGNRISCTCSGEDTAAVMERLRDSMTALFGEPTVSDTMYSWHDGHTANYAMLTVLNETTVQLAFYISEPAEG